MTNNLSPAERLTYSTVRIECALRGRNVSAGTGFCCSLLQKEGYYAPVIVTSRRVVEGAQRGRLHLNLADATGQPSAARSHTIVLDDFQARWLPHPEPAVELCVMPIAELLVEAQQRARLALQMIDRGLIATAAELAELTPIEEIVVVGYPNGVWDSAHNRPVTRKGITATAPTVDYMGRAAFLIDVAWLPGASGSPVFLWNMSGYTTPAGELVGRPRVKLLGMLTTSPTRPRMGAGELINGPPEHQVSGFPANPDTLGVVVQARKVLEFEPILEALAARGQQRWSW
jgi:hypothetical protein